jgi:hypothetical protein
VSGFSRSTHVWCILRGHIGADIAWLGLLAFAVSRGANILGPHYKKVVQASGLAMIVFGLYFIRTILFS